MATRFSAAGVLLGVAIATFVEPASAATHHRHHHRVRSLARGLPVAPDPIAAATPDLTGQTGTTTDVNVFPDLSIGDGFPGFQTPGLGSYGLAGGGLWGTPALR